MNVMEEEIGVDRKQEDNRNKQKQQNLKKHKPLHLHYQGWFLNSSPQQTVVQSVYGNRSPLAHVLLFSVL